MPSLGTFGVHGNRNPADAKRVGLNLKQARHRALLSQSELAEAMVERGHSAWRQTTVSRVERGERSMWYEEVIALEDITRARLYEGTQAWDSLVEAAGQAVDALLPAQFEAKLDEVQKGLDELRQMWAIHMDRLTKGQDHGRKAQR